MYNSQSNFFSEISLQLYNILNDNNWSILPKEVIDELLKQRVVVEDGTEYDFYFSELLRFNIKNNNPTILSLIIAPTTACNFDCPYCFEPKKRPRIMTTNVVKQVVDFIKCRDLVKHLDITWYGGEPLLAFDQIKQLCNEFATEGMPKLISHSIITNGYLFSGEVIEFFKQYPLNRIQITLDGLKQRHDTTRCLRGSKAPSFDRIIENIDNIVEQLPDTNVDIRVNINKNSYMDFVNLYSFMINRYRGKNVYPYPGIIREDTEDGTMLCSSSYKTSEIMDLYRDIEKAGIDTNIFPYRRVKGCMMHSNHAFIIGPEGELYKCWNDVSDESKIIGHISSNKLSGQSRLIKYSTQAIPFCNECKDCLVFPICDGGCSYHRYRNMFEGCKYDLCSPYKNTNNLITALLTGELTKR